MRKPKKAFDIYRNAISTIFIFIPVLLVALYSITSKLKSKPIQVNSQPTLRNRGQEETETCLRWPSLLCWLFFTGPPTSLTSWYLLVCLRLLHIPVIHIYTLILALFLCPHFVWSTKSLTSFLAAITAKLLRDFWLSLELGKFNCEQETYNCECTGFLLQ